MLFISLESSTRLYHNFQFSTFNFQLSLIHPIFLNISLNIHVRIAGKTMQINNIPSCRIDELVSDYYIINYYHKNLLKFHYELRMQNYIFSKIKQERN